MVSFHPHRTYHIVHHAHHTRHTHHIANNITRRTSYFKPGSLTCKSRSSLDFVKLPYCSEVYESLTAEWCDDTIEGFLTIIEVVGRSSSTGDFGFGLGNGGGGGFFIIFPPGLGLRLFSLGGGGGGIVFFFLKETLLSPYPAQPLPSLKLPISSAMLAPDIAAIIFWLAVTRLLLVRSIA